MAAATTTIFIAKYDTKKINTLVSRREVFVYIFVFTLGAVLTFFLYFCVCVIYFYNLII